MSTPIDNRLPGTLFRNPSDPDPEGFDQRPSWRPEEIPLGDGRTLVLDDTCRPEALPPEQTAAKNILGKADRKATLSPHGFPPEIS